MPRISTFYGIVIMMFYNDHPPAHFHVKYGDHRARIEIDTLEYLTGKLPQRVRSLVMEWATMHRGELRRNWETAKEGKPLFQIDPLE
ncbi:MAG: DUF4160 domain-containing protein [Ignavibacteriae bacterium]|nr:DUF4160 domain-containing protein [Ignavibacteriota bacterium]